MTDLLAGDIEQTDALDCFWAEEKCSKLNKNKKKQICAYIHTHATSMHMCAFALKGRAILRLRVNKIKAI